MKGELGKVLNCLLSILLISSIRDACHRTMSGKNTKDQMNNIYY